MRAYRSFVATLTSLALVLPAPLLALAAGSELAPATNDDNARRCDTLAASPYDSQYSGPRAVLDDISVVEALRVCAQAAEAQPVRPRYLYLYGRTLWKAKRHAEAAQQYSAAREAGNAWGAFGLGVLSAEGAGVPQSNENAASLYREAASAGVAAAYARLMWLSFGATPPSYTEAARWAQQAADAGDSDGARVLGWCYLTGNGLRQDPGLAANWYVEAARQGSPDAMYQLSLMSCEDRKSVV